MASALRIHLPLRVLAVALVVAAAAGAWSAPAASARPSGHARLVAYKRAFAHWDRVTNRVSNDIVAALDRIGRDSPSQVDATFTSLSRRTSRARGQLQRLHAPRSLSRLQRRLARAIGRIAHDLKALAAAEQASNEDAAGTVFDSLLAHSRQSDSAQGALTTTLRRLLRTG